MIKTIIYNLTYYDIKMLKFVQKCRMSILKYIINKIKCRKMSKNNNVILDIKKIYFCRLIFKPISIRYVILYREREGLYPCKKKKLIKKLN